MRDWPWQAWWHRYLRLLQTAHRQQSPWLIWPSVAIGLLLGLLLIIHGPDWLGLVSLPFTGYLAWWAWRGWVAAGVHPGSQGEASDG